MTQANPDIQAALREAVVEAGRLALTLAAEGYQTHLKAKGEPVTSVDLACDRLLRERLVRADGQAAWLSEESQDDLARLTCPRVWLVDPVDGTRELLAGRGEWCICAALAQWGQVQAGAIYNPNTQELFEAAAGQGATLNGQPVRVDPSPPQRPVLVATRWRVEHGGWDWAGGLAEVRSCGSTAYMLAQVGCGRADGMISLTQKNEWDMAAGALFIQEAGGTITDRNQAALSFNRRRRRIDGVIAARHGAQDAVMRIAERLKAEK